MLKGKKILIGVCGGIAASKIPHLIRLLIKEDAEVRLVMTREASRFVSIETLSVLSRNEVLIDFFTANHEWNNHVKLAMWADLMLIAPLTANTLAKMASGACDNLLLATYFSARSPVVVAPAMDLDMYRHVTVAVNLKKLQEAGNFVIPAEKGELASGLSGEGRMAEPENMLIWLREFFSEKLPLHGKKVLINAGPTYEPIDPVRFIGNRSSGKMGVALANAFYYAGASVTLVLGPVSEKPTSGIEVLKVETASDMYNNMVERFSSQDIVVCAAAVADYTPAEVSAQKIKKSDGGLELHLVRTKDILARLGALKQNQFLVGFALETEQLIPYAKEKLIKKNLDMIIANEAEAGLGTNTNKVTVLLKNNKIINFELMSKDALAAQLADIISNHITHD
jgi:phosphopantothenoylcysteine decarboxylase / phosphopantothenate---cysteine ligase